MNQVPPAPTIHKLLGSTNLILVVTDGCGTVPNEPNQRHCLADFALTLARRLNSYAVINCKYKKEIMNLADIRAVRTRAKVAATFLGQINTFKNEITGNGLLPLILFFQVLPQEEMQEAMLLFGYGQGERGVQNAPHRPTLPASLLSKIRLAVEDQHLKTEVALTSSMHCGREGSHINQLYRQKEYLDDYFDPEVSSLLISIRQDLVQDKPTAESIAHMLSLALNQAIQSMPLVRNIELDNIDAATQEDLQFIFRLQGEGPYTDLLRESYIEELARSIERNGLLHPLVLLKKDDGRYKILCGFRRFQALKRLHWQWVEAKVYQETDFSAEDFFHISLAENTKRRNLNPLEIGNFLDTASNALGLNNTKLAEQFGETLGMGKPGQKVSHTTIHKYRKVNQIRTRGESPDIISDLINEKLQFSIAAEVLAPIKESRDRDSVYLNIIKPLAPTRPQLVHILALIGASAPCLHEAISAPKTQKALAAAVKSQQPVQTLIRLLKTKQHLQHNNQREDFDKTITRLRHTYFGKKARKKDFNIALSPTSRDEILVNIRIKKGATEAILKQLTAALSENDLFSQDQRSDE